MGSERARIAQLLSDRRETPFGVSRVAATDTGLSPEQGLSPRRCAIGRIGPNEIILAETGIGKVNATVGATELIREFRPDCLVSTGVAGGIDASLRVMDVVVATEVAYHDVDCGTGNVRGQVQGLPPRFACDGSLLAAACGLASPVRIHAGLIASGDRFISDGHDLAAIKAAFPEALAVDMESGAIAQTCHIFGVPFLSFRIVSDVPGAKDHYVGYENFWETMADRSFSVTRLLLEALGTVPPPAVHQ